MKTVAQNRRARFEYQILETIEAGMILTGQEVKSCRDGHIDLSGSYVTFLGGKPVLKQSKIAPYRFASQIEDYVPGRDRPLLLSKKEIDRLESMTATQGITLIPLEVRAGKRIKIVLGIAKGRKTVDKRRAIKDREMGKKLRKGEEV